MKKLPASVAVAIDTFEESDKLVRIRATIYVEREGQKGIVIGKRGEMLKKVGTEARIEIEGLLGVKVFLELFVKVQPIGGKSPAWFGSLDWHHQLEQPQRDETEEVKRRASASSCARSDSGTRPAIPSDFILR